MTSAEQPLIVDEHRYHAHPHLAVLESGAWLLVANRAPRRVVTMHPPQDPEFVNVVMRSDDEGRTWTAPIEAPGFGWTGMECAGLTPLGGGRVLLNQWRFRWYGHEAAPSRAIEPLLIGPAAIKASLVSSTEIGDDRIAETAPERLTPWARGGGATWAHVSDDEGRTWTHSAEIDTTPFSGGYGMRGGWARGSTVLLPLSDIPHYRQIFIVRSDDSGRSWGAPQLVAAVEGLEFEEPSIMGLGEGRLLMAIRENTTRTLYLQMSEDEGASWSAPKPTGLRCYPAHLVKLRDGRIIAVAGKREPPFGVSAFVYDERIPGFDAGRPIVVRTGLPNRDLGYPAAAVRSDGSLYVAYYYRNSADVTGIYAVNVRI